MDHFRIGALKASPLLIGLLLMLSGTINAQIFDPVQWEFSAEQVEEQVYVLHLDATIEENWAVYSQYLEREDGPIATAIEFDEGPHFELIGQTEEDQTNKKEGYDPVFDMNLAKFFKAMKISQRVNVLDPTVPITGYLIFMTCDDTKCLPPAEVEFSIVPVKGNRSGILQPVEWTFSTERIDDGESILHFDAIIEDGWTVYSQYLEREDGPIATAVEFDEGPHFELIGRTEEDQTNKKEGYDPVFDMNLAKFYKAMKISQRVNVLDPTVPITGYLIFMTCDDTKCLSPAEVEFSIALGGTQTNTTESQEAENQTSGVAQEDLYGISTIAASDKNCDYESLAGKKDKTFMGIFLLGMLGGFLALMTPCVFPLIPITVSFFTKSASNREKGFRDAVLYGFFILLVYVLLSVPFHLLDSLNPDILNEISTNVWLNLLFFLVFLFFAFSFFGFYEINIPSSWTNRVSAAENIGGLVGIFFMALTLSFVSFSCTGPILGTLLAGALSSDGGALQLTAGMSGFGLALALPFALFAMFPGWMSKLPKSGGWLNTVKVVLGFIEVALALKFLSNADLVMHWDLLKYELFMGLWVLVAIGLTLYVFGIIKFPHDSKGQKISKTRAGFGVLSFGLVIYLALGLRYDAAAQSFSSIKLLSGLAPPAGYSWIYPNECPNGINCFKDFQQGVTYAQREDKPILLDFTGHACVNCRKMEEHVWSDPRIFELINDRYVLISLYVDDKKELPPSEQIEVQRLQGGTRKLRNVGHKWAHFQTQYFKTNAQPYYVALSSDGQQMLNQPVGYTPNIEEYEAFLKCGLGEQDELNP